VDLPVSMIFEVTYTEPGYKGNTVSNVLKDATLSNGATAKVPTFIKIGDKVKIDTRTGEYSSKA
jgi:elongation factor P